MVQDFKKDEQGHRGVQNYADHTGELYLQQLGAAAVEKSVLDGEQTDADSAEDAVYKMYGNSAHGIINLRFLIKKFYGKDNQETADKTYHSRAPHTDRVTTGRDGYQSGQGRIQGHGNIGLAVPQPGETHGSRSCYRSRHVGGHKDQAHRLQGLVAGGAYSAAAVKPEPGEPEDEHAQGAQGQTVTGNGVDGAVLVVFADTGSQQISAYQGSGTAHAVHRQAAGKIMKTHLGQPAAAPDPMAADRINQGADHTRVDAIYRKTGTFRHGAGHDGGGGGAKHGLENKIRHAGISGAIITGHKKIRCADKTGDILAEHQPKTQNPEYDTAQGKIHKIFHDDIAGILGPGKTRFHHGETGLHEKYQHCSQ